MEELLNIILIELGLEEFIEEQTTGEKPLIQFDEPWERNLFIFTTIFITTGLVVAFGYYTNNYRPPSQDETDILAKMMEKFNDRYPPGD
jgi:hypothetical protein